jgi:hypothetical protein
MCETRASTALPPVNPPGPRKMSMTPRPLSWRVALAPGKARPWSVVQMTSVFSASPSASRASSTAPTPRSRDRALSWNAAMSRRVSGVSGRFGGGMT